MAINHNLTDKETRKAKIAQITYATIAVALTIFAIYSNIEKPEEKKDDKTQPKTTICTINTLEPTYTQTLEKYATENNAEVLGNNPTCDITIARNVKDINTYNRLTTKTYALVARYNSPLENITTQELMTLLTTQTNNQKTIVWDTQTDQFIRSTFEEIGVGQRVVQKDEIKQEILKSTNTLAIIPFEEITLAYKVISIDNLNPISKDFNTLRYPLIDRYWIKGDENTTKKVSEYVKTTIPETNLNPSQITTLTLTGSSAVGSGIQQSLYTTKGIDYINPTIQNLIKESDIAQINNEASLATPCVQTETTTKYCTTENNLKLIKDLGFDVVGVNGNHIMDISYERYQETLQWYAKNKLEYYAGGTNSEDAWTPRIVEANKLKFAFIGFNYLYPFSYYATKNTAGSANVNMEIMKTTIEKAKKLADIVVVDMSWGYEYDTDLLSYQTEYAQAAVQYGANIVIGTNSRIYQQAQITDKSMIFYGLGSFLPHTYEDSQSAIYTLTYYKDKPINLKITPIKLSNQTVTTLEGSELDSVLQKVYSNIKIN